MMRAVRIMLGVVLVAATLVGCSRISIVYNTGDFWINRYANSYFALTEAQQTAWEPQVRLALARHRTDELPYLASWFDQWLQANQSGFDQDRVACLLTGFETLYQRHARIAVELAASLLATATPAQIDALARRFRQETRDDLKELAERDEEADIYRRARRYVKAIGEWTGPLNQTQQALVLAIAREMPRSQAAIIQYRDAQREHLIGMLRAGATEEEIRRMLASWLVEFAGLPQPLRAAVEVYRLQFGRLVIEVGNSLTSGQRERFERRLRSLRKEFMDLQSAPRLAPLPC